MVARLESRGHAVITYAGKTGVHSVLVTNTSPFDLKAVVTV